LLERIKGEPNRSETRKLAPELHVRESCGFQLRPHKNSPDIRNGVRA
jgi:hypothetical protein